MIISKYLHTKYLDTKNNNCYHLEYSDYCLHFYCHSHNVSAKILFVDLQVFHVEHGTPNRTSNIPRDNNYQASSQKFRHIKINFIQRMDMLHITGSFFVASFVARQLLNQFQNFFLSTFLHKIFSQDD